MVGTIVMGLATALPFQNRINLNPILEKSGFECFRISNDLLSDLHCKLSDLFQPSMLYDYSDFARVLHTLSRLSNCAKARARISGFPVQAGSTSGVATSHDEDQV